MGVGTFARTWKSSRRHCGWRWAPKLGCLDGGEKRGSREGKDERGFIYVMSGCRPAEAVRYDGVDIDFRPLFFC